MSRSLRDALDMAQMFNRLYGLGVIPGDALALRRISMTLHRWHELECGDGNDHGSWYITRGYKDSSMPEPHRFRHDDDGKPYLEHHHYMHGRGKDTVHYIPLADRERGAKKRLAKIMARYPALVSYIQTDPRGCALYILRRADVGDSPVDQVYNSRGVAVYK